MNSSKFDQMFKFISQYKYEINKSVLNNLKCVKCKNIIINAYCIPCGCSYCYVCVNNMLSKGERNCPGKNKNCRHELLSKNQVDFKANIEISNVVIKCPEEMCLHECAIINMEEHLCVCEKKSVKCPFADLGCDVKKIAREMLNDHCQSANFDHCKILIEMIDNMRNEIDILKDNDKMNQLKIENLEINLKSKDEIIDKINKEIQSIKMEKENSEDKIDDKLKIENDDHQQECNKINDNLERNTEELFVEIEKEKQERIKSINEIKMETNEKSEMMEKRMNKLNKIIDYFDYAMIEWRIDKLDELRKKKDGWIVSEYFSGMKKLYNLQLLFYANGYGDVEGRGCSIYLCVCCGSNDKYLTWPFSADVTIEVVSKTNPNIKKSITKYCKKEKPINYPYNYSEVFNYLFCDLTEQQEDILDNYFIVECFVDFK